MLRNLHEAIGVGAIIVCLAIAVPASAQNPLFPEPNLMPPPPPPPPPPKIEIPKIPKLGEIASPPGVNLPQRGSFSDRISRCIDEAAAWGLGPNERASYSSACANAR
jgi:hypothetical protein